MKTGTRNLWFYGKTFLVQIQADLTFKALMFRVYTIKPGQIFVSVKGLEVLNVTS